MTSVEPPPSRTYQVVDDIEGEFAERVVEAFHYRRDELFRLVLTAGDVARRCYERLALHAETQIDWWLVDVWTPDTELARRTLLDRVGAAYALHDLLVDANEPPAGTDPLHAPACRRRAPRPRGRRRARRPGPGRLDARAGHRDRVRHRSLPRPGRHPRRGRRCRSTG